MYRADKCPCCASTHHVAYPALVAPFLASYVLGVPPGPTRLLECEACGFRYFEDRLDESEVGRLYEGYRGDRYFEERHRHEPWYTRRANDAMGSAPEIVTARRASTERFVRRHVETGSISDVLDFGGDHGQFIPEGIGAHHFVYDVSDLPPVSGVTRLEESAMRARRFDMVLLSHVLEHCSEPFAVLRDVRGLLRSPKSLLYVELPYERAQLSWVGRGRTYAKYLQLIGNRRLVRTAIDLYSTAARVRLGWVPPMGFMKMHEHLNFFDERSVRRLLERSGFDVVACEVVRTHTALGDQENLLALARPASGPAEG